MESMTELVTTARRKGTGELLLTSGLLVVYTSLQGDRPGARRARARGR